MPETIELPVHEDYEEFAGKMEKDGYQRQGTRLRGKLPETVMSLLRSPETMDIQISEAYWEDKKEKNKLPKNKAWKLLATPQTLNIPP